MSAYRTGGMLSYISIRCLAKGYEEEEFTLCTAVRCNSAWDTECRHPTGNKSATERFSPYISNGNCL